MPTLARTRALLRGAGRAARAGHADGPQVGVEAAFEAGDGKRVRPGPPIDQVAEAGEVHVGEFPDGSKGATVHRLRDANGKQSSRLGEWVGCDDVGPVLDEFDRSADRFLAGHEPRVRPRLVIVPQVETNDSDTSVGGSMHDGFYQHREDPDSEPHHSDSSAHLSGTTAKTPAEDPVSRARDQYVPKGMASANWLAVRGLAEAALAPCLVKTPYEMQQLLGVLAHYFDFGTRIAGYPPEVEALLSRTKIVAYINHLKATSDLSPATLGTYRSRLLRVADANIGHIQPSSRMPGFRGADGSTPYTDAEDLQIGAWLASLPQRWQADYSLMHAVARGGGLTTGEVLTITAEHVEVDSEGVLLHVPGARARAVPVLAEYESVVADVAAAAWKPDMFLFRPKRQARSTKVLSDMLHKAPSKPFAISVQRLRATWIVTHLKAQTPVQALLDAAGIETLGALGRFYDYVPPVEATAARAALTMRARSEGCRASVNGRPLRVVDDE